jgi:hypothetical protein
MTTTGRSSAWPLAHQPPEVAAWLGRCAENDLYAAILLNPLHIN